MITHWQIECLLLAAGWLGLHRLFRFDLLLYKRLAILFCAFITIHIFELHFLQILAPCVFPGLFVIIFLLHYTSIASISLSPDTFFISSLHNRATWLQDITKTQMYAYHQKKKLHIYIMHSDTAHNLFAHNIPMHAPVNYDLLMLLMKGSENTLTLLIDSTGHIRSCNPRLFNLTAMHLSGELYFELHFDESTKTFTLNYGQKKMIHLSATHAINFINQLLAHPEKNRDSFCTLPNQRATHDNALT